MIDFLIGVFIDDYMERRLDLDQSGWRSLTDIARAMNIPQSQVYGDPRYGHDFGSALEPLIKQGLVEYRIFEGKGRGGKVVKVRAHYEREPIRRRVDTEAWKPSRQTA